MLDLTKKMLNLLTGWEGAFQGAFSIRENGSCASMRSTEHVHLRPKTDKPGLDIRIDPDTRGETVSIPACVTHGDVDDLVYNDFYVGAGADVTVVAGCGVHTENGEPARHNGIHRFFVEKGARLTYVEKHIGLSGGGGARSIDPVTEIFLAEDAVMEMESTQLRGVDKTLRRTTAQVAAGAKLLIRERILTEGTQEAHTEFQVEMQGPGARADIISRSVARGQSYQSYQSTIIGQAPCTGHSECDAIIDGDAKVDAAPKLCAHHADASLIHEAAIGKIAGEQILKLCTLGLTEQEAEAKIIEGFLS